MKSNKDLIYIAYLQYKTQELHEHQEYQRIHRLMINRVTRTANPSLTIMHDGKIEHKSYDNIFQSYLDQFILDQFPMLHENGYKMEVIICPPDNLNFTQIDMRMNLFYQYQEYKLYNLYDWPCYANFIYKTTGQIYQGDKLFSFDEWLYVNGHKKLVKVMSFPNHYFKA